MVREQHGNLFEAEADALVNTVNTVGVMGKGIALQFKRTFPAMFKAYETAAKAGQIELGRMHVYATGSLSGPRYVINFPTKGHWRARSSLADVKAGLIDLVATVRELDIRSIAIPPLGCGNGGLRWTQVRPLIVEAFVGLPDVDVVLYPPEGAPAASSMVDNTNPPRGRVHPGAVSSRSPGAFSKTPSFDISGILRRMAVAAIQRSASCSRWLSAWPARWQATRSSA